MPLTNEEARKLVDLIPVKKGANMMTPEEARGLALFMHKNGDEVAASVITELCDQVEALQADADRYRFLRMQHWSESEICVVSSPKEAVKLGYDCPCTDRLDAAIDAQIAARKDQP